MSAPPQSNATVSAVRGAGAADDWDRAGAAGVVKWVGQARAYYRESTSRETAEGGATNIVTKRELIVTMQTLGDFALDTDDVITFRPDGAPADLTGTAQAIPRVSLGGIPRSLQTSRIRLENA